MDPERDIGDFARDLAREYAPKQLEDVIAALDGRGGRVEFDAPIDIGGALGGVHVVVDNGDVDIRPARVDGPPSPN